MHHVAPQISERGFAVEFDFEAQNAFLRTAADGQHAVRRDFGDGSLYSAYILKLALGILHAGMARLTTRPLSIIIWRTCLRISASSLMRSATMWRALRALFHTRHALFLADKCGG
jgi:hypothetical protein